MRSTYRTGPVHVTEALLGLVGADDVEDAMSTVLLFVRQSAIPKNSS